MAVVVFDAAEFRAMYPSFATSVDLFLSNCFARATRLLNNTESSVVSDAVVRKSLLYLATAHIGTLESRGVSVVGQMTSASQGSVSSSFSDASSSGTKAYWAQTQYGMEFWEAVLPYRSFMYV